ncbi:RHS repeat-associated core domain-containing protein [Hymenobacter norwichensis]|uniref:RHS repeat-associated core domain-containing protein n=1 Tax=Hymenobacter norwichensis TaxID=223903 RepID=UPI0003B5065D|nr:RHS repeat-associated core domain-containing protein [Hymenobacter norwichensis]
MSDHLGTPLELHGAGDAPVWATELDSYGQVRRQQGDATACPFRYQGQYEDQETGLYYNHFRYYSPYEGLYISQDPIRVRGGLSLYSYAHDSTTWVCHFGLAPGPGLITYPVSADSPRCQGHGQRVSIGLGHWRNNWQLGRDWQGDPRNINFLENYKHPGEVNNHVHGAEGHEGTIRNVTWGDPIDRQAMIDRHRQAQSVSTLAPALN